MSQRVVSTCSNIMDAHILAARASLVTVIIIIAGSFLINRPLCTSFPFLLLFCVPPFIGRHTFSCWSGGVCVLTCAAHAGPIRLLCRPHKVPKTRRQRLGWLHILAQTTRPHCEKGPSICTQCNNASCDVSHVDEPPSPRCRHPQVAAAAAASQKSCGV